MGTVSSKLFLIKKLRNSGLTYQAIGEIFGVHRQTIFQILKGGCGIFNIYHGIRQRCYNPRHKDYKYYGGRGIKCEWESFDDFQRDMKSSYKIGLSIDRADVNGNYNKHNCHWIPRREQPKNRRPFSEWQTVKKVRPLHFT